MTRTERKAKDTALRAKSERLARERQAERRAVALRLLADWPQGMPPLAGLGIGTLVGLEKEGLAARLGPDSFGDLRFTLTPAGQRAAAGVASA